MRSGVDPFKVLEVVLDEQLAATKRELMQMAAKSRMMGGKESEDTVVYITVEVDLNAILRCATSSRTVQQVQQAEG